MTLSDLLDRYLTTIQHLVKHSANTRESFVKRIKKDWPEGKAQLVRDVKPSTVKQFIAGQSKRVGKVTLNAYRRVLRDSFKLAVEDKVISVSPAADLKGQRPETPIRTTPTIAEFKAIVAQIRGQKFSDTAADAADFVEFMGLAGLGNAEAAALTWKDVDFKNNRITTFRHKTTTGFVIPLYGDAFQSHPQDPYDDSVYAQGSMNQTRLAFPKLGQPPDHSSEITFSVADH